MNALITGATKGIGLAIALSLAKEGYHLAVCARNEQDLQNLAQELSVYEVRVVYLATDCSDREAVQRFCEFAASSLGDIDVLVNNAGAFLPGPLLDEPEGNLHFQLSLNLNAAYHFSRFF